MTSVIYFVKRQSDKAIKIGTTKNLDARLSGLRQQYRDIELIGIIKGGTVREKLLHWIFEGQRLDGEFFRPDDELLEIIQKYAKLPTEKSPKEQAENSAVIVPTVDELPAGVLMLPTVEIQRIYGISQPMACRKAKKIPGTVWLRSGVGRPKLMVPLAALLKEAAEKLEYWSSVRASLVALETRNNNRPLRATCPQRLASVWSRCKLTAVCGGDFIPGSSPLIKL